MRTMMLTVTSPIPALSLRAAVELVVEPEGEVLLRKDVLASMLEMYAPYDSVEPRRAFQARALALALA